MNYAIAILALVLIVAFVYWFISGQYYYTGPRTHARIVDGTVISDDSAETLGDLEKRRRRAIATPQT